MFDSFYEFKGIGNSTSLIKPHLKLKTCKYRFSTPLHTYILEVECYINSFYVIQFYNRKLKNDPRKYQIQTNEFQAKSIVGTCIQVIKLFSFKDPKSSFGFIGSNSYNPDTLHEEPKNNTKRWRVYKHAVENEYGPETFKHAYDKSTSSYILLRKRQDISPENLLNKILHTMNRFHDKS